MKNLNGLQKVIKMANVLKTNIDWDVAPLWCQLVAKASELLKAGGTMQSVISKKVLKAKKLAKYEQGFNLVKDVKVATRSELFTALSETGFTSNGATFNHIVKLYEEKHGVDLGIKVRVARKQAEALRNTAWQLSVHDVCTMMQNITEENKPILWKVFELCKNKEKFTKHNFDFQPLFDFTYNR